MTRFWQPETEGPPDRLRVVGCMASGPSLWVVLEGPGVRPEDRPKRPLEPEPARPLQMAKVVLPSGEALPYRGSTSSGGKNSEMYLAQFDSPAEPSEPFTFQWIQEDSPGSGRWVVAWGVQVLPA